MEKPKVTIERAAKLDVEGIRAVCGTEKEYKIYVKKLMTDVVKGKISDKEAQSLIKANKVAEKKPQDKKTHTHQRNQLKQEVK